MAEGTHLMMFLITVHVLFFFAGDAGLRPSQQGENPHQAFYQNASGSGFQDSVQTGGDSNIVSDTFSVAFESLEGLRVLGGIITAPYSLFDNTDLPDLFKTLGKALLGFLEAMVVLAFIRGRSF